MKFQDKIKFVTLFLLLVASTAVMLVQLRYSTVMYNCGIAEISPDIPVRVKQECRKRMSTHLQSQKGL